MFCRPQQWLPRALLALGVAVLLAACGSSGRSATGTRAAATGGGSSGHAGASTTPAASSGGRQTLLVYSAQGYDHNTVAAFQKATGIPTKLVDDSTGPLLARIQAEKANPQWGLLWVDGATAFASLDRQNLLQRHLRIPAMNAAGRSVVPSDRSFVPTGLTMACTIIYNTRAISHPPTSWQQLLSGRYAGKIGMNDPAVSGPTYPCVAGMMNLMGGVSGGESYLKQLHAAGLKISQTNGDTLHLLQTGQIDIGLIQSSAAIGAALATHELKVAYLPKETVLPSAIGVDAKAPAAERAEAQRFIDFVFSRAGQHQMQTGDPTGDSLFWPTAANTRPLPALPSFTSISHQTINPYTWGTREPSIDTWFTNNIVR
ncbi:MAG TPA: extracellular solute-binding protein [Solirubrobacteraceae bacterium]|nr:extracellular solute-binding protein [Solirubrobacteraceae bacterium]